MGWYTGDMFYDSMLILGFLIALSIFLSQKYGTAAYGRFGGRKKGLNFGPRTGWILMEMPTLVLFPLFFLTGPNWSDPVPLFLAGIWAVHYLNRALITPLLMRVKPGTVPTFHVSVVIWGWVVLTLHCYLNGRFFSQYGTHLFSEDWFYDPRFGVGLVVYVIGFTLNIYSDYIIRNLRPKNPAPDEPRYKIPFGGAFKWVSSPQYLGELTSFLGLAIMSWNLGFVFILLVTAANLIPRAIVTHGWYKKTFDDYPPERKAVFPGIL